TGGGQRHNHPQVRYTQNDARSMELARVFGSPYYFSSKMIAGSFRKICHRMGVPTLVYEAGESMRFDEGAIKAGIQGIQNVMAHLGMSAPRPGSAHAPSIHLQRSRWSRAPKAGMFIPQVACGQLVEKGQQKGMITDTY